jgi:hypothetical protein
MEILQDFDFDYREPRSQWAPFIKTLIEGIDGSPVHAVKLIAGRDFPADAKLDNVHNGLSTLARKRYGRRARIRKLENETPQALVVGLYPEGSRASANGRSRGRTAVPA